MMAMAIETSVALSIASGGLMLSSAYISVHLVSTINPYHRPTMPIIASLVAFITGLSIATIVSGESPAMAARESISEAFVSILSLLPLVYILVTYNLIRSSLKKRPADSVPSLIPPLANNE